MSERRMRKNVCDWLKDYDAFAVENPANPGTPDVSYVEGWIELKQLDAWPAREDTPVRIEHYTPQQRIRVAWIPPERAVQRRVSGLHVTRIDMLGRSGVIPTRYS